MIVAEPSQTAQRDTKRNSIAVGESMSASKPLYAGEYFATLDRTGELQVRKSGALVWRSHVFIPGVSL